MDSKILTICIPTYNRKDVLIDELVQYLSLNDDRFCIKIHDNCSTDGTRDALQGLKDDRIIIHFNDRNVGSVPNWMNSLCNCKSEYVIFVLDKDLVNIEYLAKFIDYLETAKPNFGYVDLDIKKKGDNIITNSGLRNVERMCYLDKHPSGYFYKTAVFNEAYQHDSFQKIDKSFIFPFEVLNGVISTKYSSTIVVMPLIINAAIREKKDTRTLSFNESNIWFGEPKRFLEFSYYLCNVLELDLNPSEKAYLSRKVLKQSIGDVTYRLKNLLQNKEACYHYFVNCRKVSLGEMFSNELKFLKYYFKVTNQSLPLVKILTNMIFAMVSSVYNIAKSYR